MNSDNIILKILEHLKQFNDDDYHDVEYLLGQGNLSHKENQVFQDYLIEMSKQGYIKKMGGNAPIFVLDNSPRERFYEPIQAKITVKGREHLTKLKGDLSNMTDQVNFWKSSSKRNGVQIKFLWIGFIITFITALVSILKTFNFL